MSSALGTGISAPSRLSTYRLNPLPEKPPTSPRVSKRVTLGNGTRRRERAGQGKKKDKKGVINDKKGDEEEKSGSPDSFEDNKNSASTPALFPNPGSISFEAQQPELRSRPRSPPNLPHSFRRLQPSASAPVLMPVSNARRPMTVNSNAGRLLTKSRGDPYFDPYFMDFWQLYRHRKNEDSWRAGVATARLGMHESPQPAHERHSELSKMQKLQLDEADAGLDFDYWPARPTTAAANLLDHSQLLPPDPPPDIMSHSSYLKKRRQGIRRLMETDELLCAVRKGDVDRVKRALRVKIRQSKASDITNFSVVHGNSPLFEAVWNGHLRVLYMLLSCKPKVNLADPSKNTALHLACEKGNPLIIRALLAHGSDIDAINGVGKKPWEVVRDWKGNEDLMQFLVADSAQALEMKRRAAEMLALKEAEEQRLKDEAHVQNWKFQPVPSLDPEVEQKLWDLDYESMELDDFMEEGEKEAFKKQVWDNGWFSVFRLLFMYYTTKTLDKMEPLTFRGVIKGLRLDNPKSTIYVTLKSCDKAFEKANATQREIAKAEAKKTGKKIGVAHLSRAQFIEAMLRLSKFHQRKDKEEPPEKNVECFVKFMRDAVMPLYQGGDVDEYNEYWQRFRSMIRTSDRMQEELRNFGKGLRLRFDAYATDTTQNEMLGTRDEQGLSMEELELMMGDFMLDYGDGKGMITKRQLGLELAFCRDENHTEHSYILDYPSFLELICKIADSQLIKTKKKEEGAYDPEVDGPVLADQCTKLFKIMCGKKRNTAVSKVAVRDATAINEAPK